MNLSAASQTGGSLSACTNAKHYWRFAGRAARMVIVSIGHSASNAARARALVARAAQIGMALDQQFWGKDMSQNKCRTQVKQLNEAVDVYAVLLLPAAPAQIDILSLRGELLGYKDLIRPGAWHLPGPVRPGEIDCVLNSATAAHQAHGIAMGLKDAQIAR
ncbi:hypothetical protein ABLN87_21075 [Ruegeria sp. SCPT10]|uniref:hypothetical protein n=1 Tax=Ruegeria sp. SCP10 TaxID=3141377 RepID=UPI003334F87B